MMFLFGIFEALLMMGKHLGFTIDLLIGRW